MNTSELKLRLQAQTKAEDWLGVIETCHSVVNQVAPEHQETLRKVCSNAHFNLGHDCREKHDYKEAMKHFQLANRVCPGLAPNVNEIGNIFSHYGNFEKALSYFSEAVAYDPSFILGYVNVAYVYHRLGLHEEEERLTKYILSVDPENVLANWHDAIWTLLRGDLENGWKKYEWRFKHEIFIRDNKSGLEINDAFKKKSWKGEAMKGKTLMIFVEQGIGDFVQFMRYIPLLKRRQIKVILACSDILRPLVEGWDCIEQIVEIGSDYPKYDKHIFLLSLPLAFKTTLDTIPNKVPYIKVSKDAKEKWQAIVPKGERLRVGICATGKLNSIVGLIRACPLDAMKPILEVEGVDFYSLHVKDKPQDLANYPQIIDVTEHVDTLMDTAAFLDSLDLIITVETAVAHMAGALNKPTWVLLARTPAWRWLLDRDDSPWYPSARLFRQEKDREWDVPVQQVAAALKQRLQDD